MESSSSPKPSGQGDLKVYAITMIRNEADIILPLLNAAATLFDRYIIVDIQSTDGTNETIKSYAGTWPHIELYSCSVQERYQSAMMNALAQKAVNEGADWIFFLDGDEFVNVVDRAELQAYLRAFPHDVMHMPWINLVPSQYGEFHTFDVGQEFFWSGRVAPFNKVAISSLYFLTHPGFYIHEGNHHVSPNVGSPPAPVNLGLTLMHVPVRSGDRLRYRLSNGLRLLGSKHNSAAGEGGHAAKILASIADGRANPEQLNAIAATYGSNDSKAPPLTPRDLGWPSKRLPDHVSTTRSIEAVSRTVTETLLRDSRVEWDRPDFVKGSLVQATLEGLNIRISCQPMMGDGRLFRGRYQRLPAINASVPQYLSLDLLIDSVAVSFLKPRIFTFSAWSNLIPALFSIFALTRPRRFVELGVHNGMSFFAACQVAEHLKLDTQCVAVDSWIGDPHASFHSPEVFDLFRKTIKSQFPAQHYIQAYFADAPKCFDDESIDLLHIDGYHSYTAVKEDFETWLSKMSQSGVILFHDVNVHEKGFGVWRFWEELKDKYPSISFSHCHGLGILYVGRQSNAILEVFSLLQSNKYYLTLAQQYFESIGELAIDHRALIEEFRPVIANRDAHAQAQGDPRVKLWQEKFVQASRSKANKRNQKKDYKLLKSSAAFDAVYYLSNNSDVRNAGTDPVWHFVSHGAGELRNPNATFSMAGYLLKNEDVLDAGLNPFVHYLLFGQKEGREW